MNQYLLILAVLTLAACAAPDGWKVVKYTDNLRCDSLHSANADGRPLECRAWMEGDTVAVLFPKIDLGWAYITLKIHDDKFQAQLDGVPFHTAEVPSFETTRQHLYLAKENHEQGDTLCARFDLQFRIAYSEGEPEEWTFRGAVCEVIRAKDFDPFAAENFITFDLPTALHEMGQPLDRDVFGVEGVTEFSIELINHFPSGTEFVCEELTWDVSPMREVSDEGRERLTVWYVERDGRWMPVEYKEWNTDTQF